MGEKLTRREFLQASAAGGAVLLGSARLLAEAGAPKRTVVISPGCRRSKVKVAKIYMGIPGAHWPTPRLDLKEEMEKYEAEFARMKKDFADVDFVVNELVTSAQQLQGLKEKMAAADGILAIHLSMGGASSLLGGILSAGRPTMLFAAPYSGHEWTGFGGWRNAKEGALLECLLTSDTNELAVAIRPFRAIHHLREAKILDVTTRDITNYANAVKEKFGTEMKKISREQVLDAYNSIPDAEAKAEAKRWIDGADKVVEPSDDEIFRSLKLALAFEKLLNDEDATMITVDCYGTMWDRTILLPAYPCLGHARLNNMGLGGMCESDLQSAMTQILFQGIAGKPGFCNDPTMDMSKNAIVLAHCMGTPKMDGPDGETERYRLRCVMERQEGAVCQVFMKVGKKTTTAELLGTDLLLYFTGDIIETPDLPRGCRTKITVKVDGDAEKLWQNWSHGLHRTTCYGDLTKDLKRFCRFKAIKMVNEA